MSDDEKKGAYMRGYRFIVKGYKLIINDKEELDDGYRCVGTLKTPEGDELHYDWSYSERDGHIIHEGDTDLVENDDDIRELFSCAFIHVSNYRQRKSVIALLKTFAEHGFSEWLTKLEGEDDYQEQFEEVQDAVHYVCRAFNIDISVVSTEKLGELFEKRDINHDDWS